MSKFALICGTVGGVWAILSGLGFLVYIIGTATPQPAIVVVLAFIMLMGVLALIAIAQSTRRPRLASKLILSSFTGILIAAFLGIGVWDFIVLPATILLMPALISKRRII